MQRRVNLFHQRDRFAIGCADHHAVGLHEIFDRGTFAQKLGIGRHRCAESVAPFAEDFLDHASGADRYGRFCDIKQRMVGKVIKALCGSVKGKTIAILGLAFKPETDDMRDSPAIPLITGLQKEGATIRAYDPQAIDNAARIFSNVKFCRDAYETAEGADALVIATEWNEFRALKLERIRTLLKQPVIIDLRNVYDPQRMKSEGFTYVSVGRGEKA
ncbi:MAG: hypothetical protein DMF59_18275 [Acidobacteria bacterium]|nr:MAG: hypothetical protein DMF59_18275 [Acidobacteriota bacterium]